MPRSRDGKGSTLLASSKVAALVTGCAPVVPAGCSSSPGEAPKAVTLRYDRPGPQPVGVTTLDLGSAGQSLGERGATVSHPADAAAVSGHARIAYSEASTLPLPLQCILPGYVVDSAEYLERGLAARAVELTTRPTSAQDPAGMWSSFVAVERASGEPVSPLSGVVDPERVAAVGHAAGGGTAFNALESPSIRTAIGWAPVPPAGTPVSKPMMLIGTEGDTVVTPSTVTESYNAFRGPKVLVEISGEGHNSSTDICTSSTDICTGIRAGGGLISYAVSAGFVSAQLADLGINGRQSDNIGPVRFWSVVHYFTVLQLERQLGGHASGSIPTPAPTRFPGFTVTITQPT